MQCPTTVIPFFGDQPFWGDRVHARGLGPPPIPVEEFSLEKLVGAIKFMLDPQVNSTEYPFMHSFHTVAIILSLLIIITILAV